MKTLRYAYFLFLALCSQWLWAASSEVLLGPVIKEQQSQDGSYWIQLAAVKKADAVDRLKKANPDLNIAFHTDNNGLKRVLAGPYESYSQAESAKRKMGKAEAFVRFIKRQAAAEAASINPVQDFIDREKQECSEAVKQQQPGENAKCPCCLHIRNNTLIRH